VKPGLASYPEWRTDPIASTVCKNICKMIIERAKDSAILGSVENQIMYLCHDIGISKGQFEEVRRAAEWFRTT
jgi:hypothetical protein